MGRQGGVHGVSEMVYTSLRGLWVMAHQVSVYDTSGRVDVHYERLMTLHRGVHGTSEVVYGQKERSMAPPEKVYDSSLREVIAYQGWLLIHQQGCSHH